MMSIQWNNLSCNKLKMTKNFKQMFSDEENRNNIQYGDNSAEVDYVQNDPENMDTFLNLEDTFIESKKNYAGKMWSNVIVGRKERHLEINRFNYMTSHVEPASTEAWTFVGRVGFSYDSNMIQTPRFLKFPDQAQNNFRKVEILQDGFYKLTHKEELVLDATDRELYAYINCRRARPNTDPVVYDDTPLCVYHIQWDVIKTLSTSGTDPNGTVSFKLTLGEMHPRITWYCSLYSELKKWDILEYRIIWNKTDLNTNNRVDISSQVRERSNFWQVEYVNYAFDDLNKWIKQRLTPQVTPTP